MSRAILTTIVTTVYDVNDLDKKDISVIDVLSSNNKNLYTAPYLVETLKKDDKFKEEVKDGFRTSKKLIEFIGKNYLDNEILFNTALINELSFLKASLLGYKIERTKYRTSFSRRNDTNIYVETKITSGIKVPKRLYDDNKFRLFIIDKDKITAHNSEDNYKKYNEINKTSLKQIHDYAILDLFQRDNNYFDLDEFLKYKLPRKIYTAYIIITSSVINLKYEVKYLVDKTSSSFISVNIEIDVDELTQISFTSEDMKLIEGVK